MAKPKTLEIDKLNLSQLTQLKQQLDQEIDVFSTSIQQLKMAQTKFQESQDAIESLNPQSAGKEVLVPVTGSVSFHFQVYTLSRDENIFASTLLAPPFGYAKKLSQMYVPGKLKDVNKVLVDIGTGYYVEKDVDAGKDYCKRKVKFLTEQMEKIQKIAQQKLHFREAVIETMEVKVQATLAAQQQMSASKT